MAAGVSDHVWKIDEIVALWKGERASVLLMGDILDALLGPLLQSPWVVAGVLTLVRAAAPVLWFSGLVTRLSLQTHLTIGLSVAAAVLGAMVWWHSRRPGSN